MFRVYHISTIYIHGSKHVITYYEVQGSKACHSFTTSYRCPRMSLICHKIHVSILSCKYWGNVTEGKVLSTSGVSNLIASTFRIHQDSEPDNHRQTRELHISRWLPRQKHINTNNETCVRSLQVRFRTSQCPSNSKFTP